MIQGDQEISHESYKSNLKMKRVGAVIIPQPDTQEMNYLKFNPMIEPKNERVAIIEYLNEV